MMTAIWSKSFRELKNLRCLTTCGMMAALAIALNYVASFNLGPYLRIGISGLPNQVVAFLYGPGVGMIFGAALDVIKYMLKPDGGPFFPGYTLNAAIGGMIYGLFLYNRKLPRIDMKKKNVPVLSAVGILTILAGEILAVVYYFQQQTWLLVIGIVMLLAGDVLLFFFYRHLFLAQLLVKIIVNLFLNTLWLSVTNGKAFLAILPPRLLSNTIMLPVDTILLFIVLSLVCRIRNLIPSEHAKEGTLTGSSDASKPAGSPEQSSGANAE